MIPMDLALTKFYLPCMLLESKLPLHLRFALCMLQSTGMQTAFRYCHASLFAFANISCCPRCGVHIYQFRGKRLFSKATPYFPLNVTLKDANGQWIKNTYINLVDSTAIDSDFPWTFDIRAGSQGWSDTDPLLLMYSRWSAITETNRACRVGGYDSGYRQMDCAFPC
jgi:hypothetical protein